MTQSTSYEIHALDANDVGLLRAMSSLFAAAFGDAPSYAENPPRHAYLERLLRSECFVALVATIQSEVVGGLAAYELQKFEQERSEIYVYDLAVSVDHRRRGVATMLIEQLTDIARDRGEWVIFVQADLGDDPAIALYSRLGHREDVLHFDIAMP